MIAQLNSDSKISKLDHLTVVDTGRNFRVYDHLFLNRYFVYCGHKCDDTLKSEREALEIASNLKAINPVYLICGSNEGYLIADNFEALPYLSRALTANGDFVIHRGEKIHRLAINHPFYRGNISYTEKI